MSWRALRRAIARGFLGAALGTHASAASAESRLGLQVRGGCPTREQVATELSPLLQGYALDEGVTDLVATVEDLDGSYRVSVNLAEREVLDPARECLERARVAAVFLALNLPSPDAQRSEPARPPAIPTLAIPTGDVSAAGPPRREVDGTAGGLRLELRPFVLAEAAAGSAGDASTGVGMGASMRAGSIAVSLLGALTTPTTPNQAAGQPPRFELQRSPWALLFGWEASLGALGLGGELGPAVDVLRFDGKEVPHPDRELRANLGVRLNAVVRLRASRTLAAELLPVVSWFPRTYLVQVEPSLLLAETPRLWFGINLGLNYEVWGG